MIIHFISKEVTEFPINRRSDVKNLGVVSGQKESADIVISIHDNFMKKKSQLTRTLVLKNEQYQNFL